MVELPLTFSIIIPTYARPEALKQCLESLTLLDYPRAEFEVIVVDDGSPMSLDAIVNSYQSQLTIKLLKQVNQGPATARNTGVESARGRFLAFTDDDCCPTPNWLAAFSEKLRENPDCLVGGQTLNKLSNNLFSEASQLLIDYFYEYYNSQPQQATFFTSNNMALARDQFLAIGGFDTSFPLAAGEDREFCDRWLASGYSLYYLRTAQIYHAHHLNLGKFWRQNFNYGRGAYHFHTIRADRQQQAVKFEQRSFYWQLLTYPLSQRSQPLATVMSLLFFLSQLAIAAGFFSEKLQTE